MLDMLCLHLWSCALLVTWRRPSLIVMPSFLVEVYWCFEGMWLLPSSELKLKLSDTLPLAWLCWWCSIFLQNSDISTKLLFRVTIVRTYDLPFECVKLFSLHFFLCSVIFYFLFSSMPYVVDLFFVTLLQKPWRKQLSSSQTHMKANLKRLLKRQHQRRGMFLILTKISLQCPRKRYVKFAIVLARFLKQYFGHLCLKCEYRGKSEMKGKFKQSQNWFW